MHMRTAIVAAVLALLVAGVSATVGAGPLPEAAPLASIDAPLRSGLALGDQISAVQSDQDVWVEILDTEATFIDRIRLVVPYDTTIGHAPRTGILRGGGTRYHPNDVGARVNLGVFPVGTELVFAIDVTRPTQSDIDADEIPDNLEDIPRTYTLLTGSGSRNPDGVPHAVAEPLGDGAVLVRFEDSLAQDPRNDYCYCNVAIRVELGVPNVAPSISADAASVAVDEGQLATTSGTYADDNVGDNIAISPSGGIVTKTGTSTGAWSWSFQTNDGPAQSQPVTITADDGHGGTTETTFQLTVRNLPPSVATPVVDPEPSGEGVGVVASATFSDPAGANDAPFSCTVDYGDGSGAVSGTIDGNVCTGPPHTYDDNHPDDTPYTVTVEVTDKDDGVGNDSGSHVVTNAAPQLSNLSANPAAINENDTVALTGTITDQGLLDSFVVTIDWGDGNAPQRIDLAAGATTFDVMHQYLDDNPTGTSSDVNAVSVTVTDKDGGSDSASTTVTVTNLAPALILAAPEPGSLYAVSSTVSLDASFSDVGTYDTHTCAITWDDGSATDGTVTEANGEGTCTASHTFAAAGVYTIDVTLTDDDGGYDTESTFVVVYDPSAGFVTGGGFIESPAGAYKLDPTVTGKANFGFASKYQRGATVPTGQTEFQFNAGDLNFHSSSYEYLVIAGAKAQYKGEGTVNGEAGYRFILTVTDGQLPGGGGQDKFRIRIWAPGGGLIYDNGSGASVDIDASTEQDVNGGSVVIHR